LDSHNQVVVFISFLKGPQMNTNTQLILPRRMVLAPVVAGLVGGAGVAALTLSGAHADQ
jgi:hypothetical protein